MVSDMGLVFEVDDDSDAARVHMALAAAGYQPTRRGPRDRAFAVAAKQVEIAVERYDLTPRLAVTLQQLLMGVDSAEQLAGSLEISPGAARARVRRLCRAMGAADVAGVVALAKRELG